VKQLTNNANSFGSVYPCYSPDGKKIMWSDGDGDSLEIHVADANGKNAKKLTQLGGFNTFATWSADGKSIVFHHMPDYQDGPVYIMDADGGNRRELLKNEVLVKGARPAWRPKKGESPTRKNKPKATAPRRAFTLIEMLVVISKHHIPGSLHGAGVQT